MAPSRSNKLLVNALRLAWIFILLHGEKITFWNAARHCAPWPKDELAKVDPQTQDRILLIGDPQITDAYSYDRGPAIMKICEFVTDRYARRNFRHLMNRLQPQNVIYMGDLNDGGREWDDEGYAKQVARFRNLYSTSVPQYFMVGNHDIGFGDGIKPEVLHRYTEEFGPTSYAIERKHYSIVVIDTVSLSAAKDLASKHEALGVLENLPPQPRILMTHVPLYRPQGTDCGPDRQNTREIRHGRGYQYQNLLSRELSDMLLDRIQPIAVFSGDDHDYCRVWHNNNQSLEITVPTFSMAQSLRFPGAILLDLSTPLNQTRPDHFSTKLCWLPDQVGIFISYGYYALITLLILSVSHGRRWYAHRSRRRVDKEDSLPTPSIHAKRIQPMSRFLTEIARDTGDVAVIGIATFIAFLILF